MITQTLSPILKFLSGKKSAIAGIIGYTIIYLLAKGVIDSETAKYIMGLTTIMFGAASYATGKLVYDKYNN